MGRTQRAQQERRRYERPALKRQRRLAKVVRGRPPRITDGGAGSASGIGG
jgi:hypothetical protein